MPDSTPGAGPMTREELSMFWRLHADLLDSLRRGRLFDHHDEPLDAAGKRIIRVVESRMRALVALPVAAPPAVTPCSWREDEDGVWHSACGSEWASEVGATPEQHRWRFCYSCGKPLNFAALGGPNG